MGGRWCRSARKQSRRPMFRGWRWQTRRFGRRIHGAESTRRIPGRPPPRAPPEAAARSPSRSPRGKKSPPSSRAAPVFVPRLAQEPRCNPIAGCRHGAGDSGVARLIRPDQSDGAARWWKYRKYASGSTSHRARGILRGISPIIESCLHGSFRLRLATSTASSP